MSVVVVGSIAFDSIKTPFGQVEAALGGAANYFSLSASFLTKVCLVGVVGEDFPEDHIEFLKSRGVDVAGAQRKSGRTFHWKGQYGFDLNEPRTLATDLNVFADFAPELPGHYRDAETVFLANIDPTLQLQVLDQIHKPKLIALDTMNFWIDNKKAELLEAIKRVHVLFINESELRQLTTEHNVVKAARLIQEMGPTTVVVKRGEYGAILFQGMSTFFIPAYPLPDLFDPTGAGDTFAGGFLGWLDRHGKSDFETLKEAMTLGSVMASFVIERFSFDRLRTLQKSEIEERCASLQQLSHASRPILL
jgi:sugar/nucleoside kinase (ribokinase family)